jgi:hypothetical protein
MNTFQTLSPENINDPKLAEKINILLKRVGGALHIDIEVSDYNADPLEFIYTFKSNAEALKYQLSLQALGQQSYSFANKVVGNLFHESRPVSSF